MNGSTIANVGCIVVRRPGPFGPARALLPKDQQPLTIDDDSLAFDAIDRMVDSGLLSTCDRRNEVMGSKMLKWLLPVVTINGATIANADRRQWQIVRVAAAVGPVPRR